MSGKKCAKKEQKLKWKLKNKAVVGETKNLNRMDE